MMTGAKTNERPGTRAQVRHVRMSAYKVREVLDIVRGLPVGEAADVLRFTERAASEVVSRCLASAVANAQHNDELDPDTLYVSACYADEGPTLKRWRPRARGRATRIRKRMSHVTMIVSPMSPEMAAKVDAKRTAAPAAAGGGRRSRRGQESRRARVARSRGEQVTDETTFDEPTDETIDEPTDAVVEDEPTTGEPTDEMVEEAAEAAADESAEEDEDEDVAETADADEDDDADGDENTSDAGDEETK
jgi:large subunit ribosomal protein L22